MDIKERVFSPSAALGLIKAGASPVLARALAARGIKKLEDSAASLNKLIPYDQLKGCTELATILADAIMESKRLLIIADYDADGATACSVGVRALRGFGANVGYLIPLRLEHSYGLTPAIVEVACNQTPKPDYLITVDNGISSHEGIDLANSYGVPVLVTDHHLPGKVHPNATVIVNPNQHGCSFPSKALAGCGVMYYVMQALEDELKSRGYEGIQEGFTVPTLLPIVAIGTVADVVSLDTNNRILVNEGLKLIRAGRSTPGIECLAKVAGKSVNVLSSTDIAFGLGPRINAAGRLGSMDAGVECLITDSATEAETLAQELNSINGRRKEVEGDMTEEAIRRLVTEVNPGRYTAVLHSDAWHVGVIGIVSGRIKELIWRPTFVLTDDKNGDIKGSGRSIPGLRLRDALAIVEERNPGLLPKFGGHDMAAGISLKGGTLQKFASEFEAVVRELMDPEDLKQVLLVDGGLSLSEMSLETVAALKSQVWGQGFLEPVFFDEFSIVSSRAIGEGKHLKLELEKGGKVYSAVKFKYTQELPRGRIRAAYKLDANSFRNETSLQLMIEYFEPV